MPALLATVRVMFMPVLSAGTQRCYTIAPGELTYEQAIEELKTITDELNDGRHPAGDLRRRALLRDTMDLG